MHTVHHEVDLELLVETRTDVADGVVELILRDPGGQDLPVWSAGSHIDLHLGNGLTRQYSLCGDTDDRSRWRIAVLLEPESRGGSRHVHHQIQEGEILSVRGPRNHFAFEPADSYLFVAGGIGITPIVPMLAAATARGADWSLAYGGRTARSMAYAEHLEQRYGQRVRVHPQDEHGLLPLAELLGAVPGRKVYCCGPENLLKAVEEHCGHWPGGSVHTERFSPRGFDPGVAGPASFEVELAATGQTIVVPEEKSLLEALLEAGITVDSSCTEGVCGTCETKVLGGVPLHRDSVLDDDERAAGDTMFPCVSRSLSTRLVLDL